MCQAEVGHWFGEIWRAGTSNRHNLSSLSSANFWQTSVSQNAMKTTSLKAFPTSELLGLWMSSMWMTSQLFVQIGKTAIGLHRLQPQQALHLCQGALTDL